MKAMVKKYNCPVCKGSKKYDGNKCHCCNGAGFLQANSLLEARQMVMRAYKKFKESSK